MSEDSKFFRALELQLMDPATRGAREVLSVLLAADFVEIGSDGKVHDRTAIMGLLAAEAASGAAGNWEISEFLVREIAPGVALTTYHSLARGRHSMRSSLWKQNGGQWQMVFHQGTLL